MSSAVTRIYVENGVLGFWIGNGLSVAKILPESAIKFLSYESSVRCSPPSTPNFDAKCDDRNGCSQSTGTTSRTFVKSVGSAGSCRVVSVVSQVNSVRNQSIDAVHVLLILGQAYTRLKP